MEIYKGTGLEDFVIDRLALGLSNESIIAEYQALFKHSPIGFNEEYISSVAKDMKDRVKAREEEIKANFSSTNFLNVLVSLQTELGEAKTSALADKNYKVYSMLATNLLKSLEIFLKAVQSYKQKEEKKIYLFQQNNYIALQALEKDGIISIQDPKKLKKLMAIEEAEEAVVVDVETTGAV